MPLEFRYFRAPESEMGFLSGNRTCSLCGKSGRCYPLENVDSSKLTTETRKGKLGCYDCLRQDRFGFTHDTEVGFITEDGILSFDDFDDTPQRVFTVTSDGEVVANNTPLVNPPKPHVSEEAISEMRRTPDFSTWQDFIWPAHCDDFMAYLGIWEPEDFAQAAPEGEGRQLFLDMVNPAFHSLWPEYGDATFGKNILAFQCLHCQIQTGIPDFD